MTGPEGDQQHGWWKVTAVEEGMATANSQIADLLAGADRHGCRVGWPNNQTWG
jgi:hypothetical protein